MTQNSLVLEQVKPSPFCHFHWMLYSPKTENASSSSPFKPHNYNDLEYMVVFLFHHTIFCSKIEIYSTIPFHNNNNKDKYYVILSSTTKQKIFWSQLLLLLLIWTFERSYNEKKCFACNQPNRTIVNKTWIKDLHVLNIYRLYSLPELLLQHKYTIIIIILQKTLFNNVFYW